MLALLLMVAMPAAFAEPGDEEPDVAVQADPGGDAATELPTALGQRIQEDLAEFVGQHGTRSLRLDEFELGDGTLQQLEALKAAGDHRGYVRLALAYLTRGEPAPEFAGVLSGLTQAVDQSGREMRLLVREPLLPLLFELGGLLPTGNVSRYEIGFAAAMQARREQDYERQEEILRDLLAEEQVPEKVAAPLKLALGETLEAQQRFAEAVEIYQGLQGTGEEAGREADGLLRGMLILLQLDEREQAAQLADRLCELPAAAVAAAESSWQIGDLREACALEGGILAHWERTDEWWPQWERLRARIGVRHEEGQMVIPYLGQIERVQQALALAARDRRQREFFHVLDILAHAARWLPGGTSEWSSAVSPIGLRLAPDHESELRQLLIEMNLALEPVSHHQRRQQQLMLALAYIDAGKAEEALEQVELFGAEPQPNDGVAQAIRRLWGLILLTLDRDVEPAIRQLNEALYGGERELDRAATVATLADLLNASGRYAEERNLLSVELENPDVRRNQATHRRLQQRYTTLTQQSRVIDIFHQAVRDWVDARNLDWLEEIGPKDLDDPRLTDLEAVLRQPEDVLTPPAVFKLQMLVALDPEQPELMKLEGVSRALDLLKESSNSRSEVLRMVLDLVEDTRFPERLRAFILARAMADAGSRFDPMAITFLEMPESGLFDENQAATAATIAEFINVDPHDGEALYELFERRTRRPMDRAGVSITVEVARQLARLGRADLLARIADKATELEFDFETQAVSAAFALDLARMRRGAEEMAALNEPMAALALAHFAGDEISKPDVLEDLMDEYELSGLSLEDALAVQLYLIKQGRIGFGGTEFWHDFIRNANFNNANPALALELIEGLLEHETDDVRRSITVLYAPEFIDIDDPTDRDALFEILRAWEERDDAPRTVEMLSIVEAQVRERLGEAVDWNRVFANNNHPVADDLKARFLLRRGLVDKDAAQLRRVLDSMSAQEMMGDTMLPLTIPALEEAGLETELGLARRAARESAQKLIEKAWFSADYIEAARALRLIETLADESVEVPDGWLDSVSQRIGSVFRRHLLRTVGARVAGDFEASVEEATAAIGMIPTYYALYWERAQALAALGRTDEALADLEVFLRYCKDDLEYPDGLELQKKLREGGDQ